MFNEVYMQWYTTSINYVSYIIICNSIDLMPPSVFIHRSKVPRTTEPGRRGNFSTSSDE